MEKNNVTGPQVDFLHIGFQSFLNGFSSSAAKIVTQIMVTGGATPSRILDLTMGDLRRGNIVTLKGDFHGWNNDEVCLEIAVHRKSRDNGKELSISCSPKTAHELFRYVSTDRMFGSLANFNNLPDVAHVFLVARGKRLTIQAFRRDWSIAMGLAGFALTPRQVRTQVVRLLRTNINYKLDPDQFLGEEVEKD